MINKQQHAIALLDLQSNVGTQNGYLDCLSDLKHYSKFAIPPIYRKAINRMQLPLLQLSMALCERFDAFVHDGRTDVIVCSEPCADRQLANHYRVTSQALLAELIATTDNETIKKQLHDLKPTELVSSHDKVGEMATTMATRIAQSAKLKGRAFAINSGDESLSKAVALAYDALLNHKADAVLIAVANDWQTPSDIQPLAASTLLLVRTDKAIDNAKAYLQYCHQHSFVPAKHDSSSNAGVVNSALQLSSWLAKNPQDTWPISPQFSFSTSPCWYKALEQTAITICDKQIWLADRLGTKAYWQGLNDKRGGIASLEHNTMVSGTLFKPDGETQDSYYCRQAAKLSSDHLDTLAHASYDNALNTMLNEWQHLALPSDKNTLVITATNLGPYSERRKLLHAKFSSLVEQCQEILTAYNDDAGLVQLQKWQSQFTQDAQSEHNQALGLSLQLAQHFQLKNYDALALESACAGSMAALDCAINALQSKRVDYAIVAAAELPVNLHDLCLCSKQQMLSHSVIATFSEHADGFTPGDGLGVVILTRDDIAIAKNYPRLARIEAIGSSTYSKSMIAPNSAGQVEAMQHAFAQTALTPSDIDWVETHGTGTPIGDLVEIQALSEVYQRRDNNSLKLGALKTQFGHTFATAGLASLIKALLSFEHNSIPHNLLRGKLRDELNLETLNFDPMASAKPYAQPQGKRSASINGFGTGGVNYHVIISDCTSETTQGTHDEL
ncbi:polyketide synthase [Pseudoalteromonas sp. A25]|uniref:polyketide synthase n=1 Tax=Pseudoalteromonas sp. A25 TaxID=116092 RepID=UPI00156244CA|nr:polyketide synthase [Pseudoalteromonas sp. A25]